MRYCVKDDNDSLLSIKTSTMGRLLFKGISRINKKEIKFFDEPPVLKYIYEALRVQPFPVNILTEDELDMLLVEEKLRK